MGCISMIKYTDFPFSLLPLKEAFKALKFHTGFESWLLRLLAEWPWEKKNPLISVGLSSLKEN